MPRNNELEKRLWATADKLRKNMDAGEYKHIVTGLIFLKYILDAFEDNIILYWENLIIYKVNLYQRTGRQI